ncbi:hypothetical protein T439DRAFT_335443, partial [Meredithblackwellia eburnea MCA 4105]
SWILLESCWMWMINRARWNPTTRDGLLMKLPSAKDAMALKMLLAILSPSLSKSSSLLYTLVFTVPVHQVEKIERKDKILVDCLIQHYNLKEESAIPLPWQKPTEIRNCVAQGRGPCKPLEVLLSEFLVVLQEV